MDLTGDETSDLIQLPCVPRRSVSCFYRFAFLWGGAGGSSNVAGGWGTRALLGSAWLCLALLCSALLGSALWGDVCSCSTPFYRDRGALEGCAGSRAVAISASPEHKSKGPLGNAAFAAENGGASGLSHGLNLSEEIKPRIHSHS